jgi:hypothetical protein
MCKVLGSIPSTKTKAKQTLHRWGFFYLFGWLVFLFLFFFSLAALGFELMALIFAR